MWVYFYRGGWEMGANTVWYRPLTTLTTVNDQSWNGYDFTLHQGSFTNIDWVDCYYLSNPAYLDLSSADNIPYWSADRTISIWARPTSVASSWSIFLSYGDRSAWKYVWFSVGTDKKISGSIWGTSAITDTITYDNRYLVTFVVLNWDFYFYVNWKFIGSWSWVSTYKISSSYILRIWRRNDAVDASTQYYWYLSELIIEDIARTQTQIKSYFNMTKSKYWL